MKTPLFCTIMLAVLSLLMIPQQAQAQAAYGISAVGYDSSARRVYGYSATYLDYYAGYYYDPAVQGELYWMYNNEVPLDSGYSEGFADWIPAEVWTQTGSYLPKTTYSVYSNHFVRAYYYYSYCSGFSAGCYSDPFGFGNYFGNPGGGGSYGWPGFGYNPYIYVGSQRLYLGSTGVSITTPADDPCANAISADGFDAAGTPCTAPNPQPTPTPTPAVDNIELSVSPETLSPTGTVGPSEARVVVKTTPGNRNVTITIQQIPNTGGHMDQYHTPTTRPAIKIAAKQGTTDANGFFETKYYASHISGQLKVTATSGDKSTDVTTFIAVLGLQELGPGANYNLIGFAGNLAHPEGTNHWGTPEANTGLQQIADDYKNRYYSASHYPDDERISYNDQSLPWGGKFDLDKRWLNTARSEHAEHRVGINCDVRANNIPPDRWAEVKQIFFLRGSTDTNDETNTNRPHWHLRFLFGRQQSRAQRSPQDYVPEALTSALDRETGDDEWQYWTNRIMAAQALGQQQTLNEAKAFERSLFSSAEYLSLNRSDEDYVTDLYAAYLLREPDTDGYNTWLTTLRDYNAQGLNGREYLLQGFENSDEFSFLISDLTGTPPVSTCDRVAEQNCNDIDGLWDSNDCTCRSLYVPPPDKEPCPPGMYCPPQYDQ